jgi:hypothetical protein
MENILVKVITLTVVVLWTGGLFWMIKRFRKTWEQLKSGQLKMQQGQAGTPPPLRVAPELPKTNPLGIVTETLEESLAKHRKKMEQELAQLRKQQSR